MLGKKKSTSLPKHESKEELCNRMANFFDEKIQLIHNGLVELQVDSLELDSDRQFPDTGECLTDFSPLTEDEVRKLIKQSATKSCCLDPIPTQLVKECLDVLLPLITRIINQSFSSAYVPKFFKIVLIENITPQRQPCSGYMKTFYFPLTTNDVCS